MTKLVQKHFLKGTQEFEIIDDHVDIRIKAPFKDEERLTVMLTVIDPEPVISKSYLNFNSRVNGCPLLTLFSGNPSTEEFNNFIGLLKQRAQEEYSSFAGLKAPTPLQGNVYDEPPEFDDSNQEKKARQDLEDYKIEHSIKMLIQQLGEEDIKPFLSALEALQEEPDNPSRIADTVKEFNDLGPRQGAVLTYAPYINVILADDPFKGL